MDVQKFGEFNEGYNNLSVKDINDKISNAAYSMKTFGTLTKQASFINGAKWAIHNLSMEEIKLMKEQTSKDDFSFFGI